MNMFPTSFFPVVVLAASYLVSVLSFHFVPHRFTISRSPRLNHVFLSGKKSLSSEDINTSIRPLMELSAAYFTSQALSAFVKLGIADVIGDENLSLEQICTKLGTNVNKDALQRTLRLLESAGILEYSEGNCESEWGFFSLSNTGALLQTQVENQPSMACGVLHWTEEPLWNAWMRLPEHIMGKRNGEHYDDNASANNPDPFSRFNGISSDCYYNAETQPESLQYANDFVRFISNAEVDSMVSSWDWSQYANKTILDIGGYDGRVLKAIASKFSNVHFTMKSLDLPQIVEGVKKRKVDGTEMKLVELIGGDVFDPSSLPSSHVIIMKHFLDRCMWTEEQTVKILQICRDKIPTDGQIILVEAVIPDFGRVTTENRMEVAMDALYMIVGRERQRTLAEWRTLTVRANLNIKDIIRTTSASSSLIILSRD